MTNVEVLKNCGFYNDVKENVDIDDVTERNDYINSMSRKELLNAYLEWNGIIGYTDYIISLVTELVNNDETNMVVNDLYAIDFDNKCDGSMVD